MLLSLAWLKEFVPYTGSAEELGSKLTMLGLELENIIEPYKAIEGIVIGYVKECEKHPEADKLNVCKVDIGQGELLQIVCGAPNVGKDQYVPVATVGTIMPEGMEIKKAKLRNVESMGMICSERELKLSEDHNGIMILNDMLAKDKLVLGAKLVDALELDKEVLEIGITPNRADCLSVLGMAREVALAYDLPLTMPNYALQIDDSKNETAVQLEVDKEICPLYTGRVLENAHYGTSPAWLKYRLNAVGIRSISNIVDATNYVLLELGLPLHAFDKDTIDNNTICVRKAKEGEKYTTLDSKEHSLKDYDILIADKNKPLGIGGIMGGLNSEITENTKNIFLEAAVFHPSHIRKSARRLGISSDASYRFERGVDAEIVDIARDRCAYLIMQMTNATCKNGVVRSQNHVEQTKSIDFNYPRCISLLGCDISLEFCLDTLKGLGFELTKKDTDNYSVVVPSWRNDVSRPADLFEEIIRVFGVDSIPEIFPPVLKDLTLSGKFEGRHPFLSRVRHYLAGMGLNECVNYSFVGDEDLDRLNLPKEPRVNIANPLTADQNVLRTELAPGLFNALKLNMGHNNTSLKLFEVSQTFIKMPSSETGVHEVRRCGILLTGQRNDHYPHKNYTQEVFEYADLKGIVENIYSDFLNLPMPVLTKIDNHPYLSPAVHLIRPNGSPLADLGDAVGVLGRLKPEIADFYNARDHVWYAELNLCAVRAASGQNTIQFKDLPIYPPVRRDITLTLPTTMQMKEVIDTLSQAKTALLENVELHDSYMAVKGAKEHNLTFRLTFRSKEKTLQDNEVDKEMEKLVKMLGEKLDIKI